MRDVYPSLRTYCQQRGLEFQVVDMRWGVRDEATADHKTNELCMQEIKNCQRLTPGPNFVVVILKTFVYLWCFPRKQARKQFLLKSCVFVRWKQTADEKKVNGKKILY